MNEHLTSICSAPSRRRSWLSRSPSPAPSPTSRSPKPKQPTALTTRSSLTKTSPAGRDLSRTCPRERRTAREPTRHVPAVRTRTWCQRPVQSATGRGPRRVGSRNAAAWRTRRGLRMREAHGGTAPGFTVLPSASSLAAGVYCGVWSGYVWRGDHGDRRGFHSTSCSCSCSCHKSSHGTRFTSSRREAARVACRAERTAGPDGRWWSLGTAGVHRAVRARSLS